MKRVFTFIGLISLASLGAFAQNQSTNATSPEFFTIAWDKTFGGDSKDNLQRILHTQNGEYLLMGTSFSSVSGDKSNVKGGSGSDYWVVRIDQDGNKIWDKSIGGRYSEDLSDAIAATDGGYLLGGESDSDASGDKSEDNVGDFSTDYWIIKIDENGNRVWDKTIGGEGNDNLTSLTATNDGGYLIGGESNSNVSGNKSQDNRGIRDYWVVKIDATGNVQWDKTYGGSGYDYLYEVIAAVDEGYFLFGVSNSNISFEKSQDSKGGLDYWVVKIDNNGNKLWDKTIGGNRSDGLTTAMATPDGGYLMAGSSSANASGDKSQDSKGGADYWVVKIDGNGVIEWEKTIGGMGYDEPISIVITTGQNYLLGGLSSSPAGIDKSEGSRGSTDFWLVEIDHEGNVLWDKTIGGSGTDALNSIVASSDGGYLLGGYSESKISCEKSENSRGGEDYWIVKLNPPKASIVKGLTLINAETDQEIQELKDGDVLALATLPTQQLNIRANIDGSVESVRLKLEGPGNRNMLDNGNPYALFGNNGPDYLLGNFLPGDYTLTVTPYSEDDARGQAGVPLTIHFKVVRYSTITGLTLINAETDQDLQELQDGYELDLTALPTQSLNVRADVVGQVESVRLKLSGPLQRNMLDNGNPYVLFGNNGPDYLPGSFPPGHYTLEAIPYSEDNAKGRKGTPLTIKFEVEPALAVVGFTLVNAETDEVIRELVDSDVIVSVNLPSQQVNVRAEVVGPVQSVRLKLEGPRQRTILDNGNPYALFGNNGSDYQPGELPPGSNYRLTAIPYSKDNAMGQAGTALQITFDVVHGYYFDVARQDQTISDKSSSEPDDLTSDAMLLELHQERLTIYPNPAQSYIEIDMPLLNDHSYQLQMYDIYGRLVLRSQGKGHITESISLEDKPTGTYLIAVESQGQWVVRKLIIDK